MNRLIKLIYVHLLKLFDINELMIERTNGVKSGLEKRIILTTLTALIYGFIIYRIGTLKLLTNPLNILVIGFFISSLFCFFSDLFLIEPVVFKSDDNDMLFSLPLSVHQILFTKLFQIYLKNLVIVGIIMISLLLSYIKLIGTLTDTFMTLYIICSLFIPLVPIALSTIFAYINSYIKFKFHKLSKIIKPLLLIIIVTILYLLFSNKKTNLETFIINRSFVIYPLNYLFYLILSKESILGFLTFIILIVLVMILYTTIITNNYLQICSMLKGIKKNKEFVLPKTTNRKKTFGIIHKEILCLLSNKSYFLEYFVLSYSTSIIFFASSFIFKLSNYILHSWYYYLDLLIPFIISFIIIFKISTISSLSLEQDNRFILRTMPISTKRILISKWLSNIILSIIPIIISGLAITLFYEFNIVTTVFSFILPLISLLMSSLTCLLVDLRFVEKDSSSNTEIIKQRLINLVPPIIAIITIALPFIMGFDFNNLYKFLGTIILMFIVMSIDILYMFIFRKRLINNLFN